MLSKFPVKTDIAEYRVTIEKDHVCLGVYQFKVDVLCQEDRRITLFGLLPSKKWVKYYTYETGWSSYKQWIGKYVELATHVVNEYENELKTRWKQDESHEKGLVEWEQWDGTVVKL